MARPLRMEFPGAGDAAAADLAHRYLWGPAVDQLLAQEQMSPLLLETAEKVMLA
jgi:hypothetical protein